MIFDDTKRPNITMAFIMCPEGPVFLKIVKP